MYPTRATFTKCLPAGRTQSTPSAHLVGSTVSCCAQNQNMIVMALDTQAQRSLQHLAWPLHVISREMTTTWLLSLEMPLSPVARHLRHSTTLSTPPSDSLLCSTTTNGPLTAMSALWPSTSTPCRRTPCFHLCVTKRLSLSVKLAAIRCVNSPIKLSATPKIYCYLASFLKSSAFIITARLTDMICHY